MRVVGVVPLYPPRSRVGAWLATHEFLAYMATRGHEVTVWPYLASGSGWSVDGVTVVTSRPDIDVDVVIGHCGDNGTAVKVATAAGRPLVQLFHGLPARPDVSARLVVFNAEASRAAIAWSGESVVCHPWTDPAGHATTPGDSVTIVNCSRAKGIRTAWRAAERLPHRQFLGVQNGYESQVRPRARNFETIGAVQDMRDVWSRTRILLIPSERETWGMVGVEALASGIPVIASDLPGLCESLGDAGVFLNPRNADAWAAEIERLHDPAEWAQASNRARARSAELAADDPRPRFVEAVESVVGVAV